MDRLFLDANVLLSGLRAYRGLAQALGMPDRWYTARMAAKKKTSKKHTKRVTGKKVKPIKNALTAKLATKAATPKKKLAQKSAAPKKAVAKTKAGARKIALGKTARAAKKRVRGKSQTVDTVVFAPEGLVARSGGQSGDLQGLSNLEGADSESVDELLEEGNAFEAEAVKGVQDAGDADEGEVHSHEVPQDDVPGEYRDKDE
jgi:N utilization substance protein A